MMKRDTHPFDELELMAYLDGELPRERAAAAAAHMAGCAECKAIANELSGVSRELASWAIATSCEQMPTRVTVALEDRDRAQKAKPRHDPRTGLAILRRRRRVWPWALAGGTLLTLLCVVFTFTFLMTRPKLPEPRGEALVVGPEVSTSDIAQSSPIKRPKMASQTRSDKGATSRLEKDRVDDGLLGSVPMIARTAELALVTTDFDQSRSRLEEILKRHNGYLGDLNVADASGAARTLTATLRVPSDQLDATLAEIKKLGQVESESQQGEEVSQQYIDLQARLQNARNSEQRLTQLLQRAGKLSDVLAVEEQIENVRENIERMEAERKNLAKRVDFSTLNMKISEDYKERVQVVPSSTGTRLRNAAVDGYKMMVAGLINVLMFLVSWGPSLLLWGAVLFFPARWLWRRRNRELL